MAPTSRPCPWRRSGAWASPWPLPPCWSGPCWRWGAGSCWPWPPGGGAGGVGGGGGGGARRGWGGRRGPPVPAPPVLSASYPLVVPAVATYQGAHFLVVAGAAVLIARPS